MSTATETTAKSSATATLSCALLEHDLEIPMDIRSLADFRRWAHSEKFPERGRIDFLFNRIEVDMSPEDLLCHGSAKMEIGTVIYLHVQHEDLGLVFSDRARVSSSIAELSAEPDIVFISHETFDSNRARMVPKASGELMRYVEIEGAVDLAVEIVSDASVAKDTRRLPVAYFQAGVREFWLVDARGTDLQFKIHDRGKTGFQPVNLDESGYQFSGVFNLRYRLQREITKRGHWKYELQVAEP